MNKVNEIIENHVKSERRKRIIFVLVVSVVVVPILMFINMPNMGDKTLVSGTVTRLIGKENGEAGSKLYLSVKLDDGKEVRSFISSSGFYRSGRRVKLDKIEPLIFGNPAYVFRGYMRDENT